MINLFNGKLNKGKFTLEANSDRDHYGKAAKLKYTLSSDEESISPILPVNLNLTIYGNNFLNIGDVFTINFLPESYKEHVYFQKQSLI